LSYIQLDGDVACVVNGAGLAMATMDLIGHYGGRPANFLDIGGSSNPEKVTTALDIIQADRTSRRSCSTSSAASRAATTWRAAS
jgi:succinyl-CoA synthetase beta subunit